MVFGFTEDFDINKWEEFCYNFPHGTSFWDKSLCPFAIDLKIKPGPKVSGDLMAISVQEDCTIQFDWEIVGTNWGPTAVPVGYSINKTTHVQLNSLSRGGPAYGSNVLVNLKANDIFNLHIGPTILTRFGPVPNNTAFRIFNFLVQSTSPKTDGFSVLQNNQYINPVSDQGSRAHTDIIFWDPTYQGTNYFFLGMLPQKVSGYPQPPTPPTNAMPIISPNNISCLSSPDSFSLLWSCVGNDQASNLGIFEPVPPEGFVALGSVAVSDFNIPPGLYHYALLRCVKKELCQKVPLTKENLIWTDQGSGAPKDVSVWLLPNAGCCIATIADGYPDSVEVWDLIQPMNP